MGSIPACAGEPPVTAAILCCWRVYPRVCGGTSRLMPSEVPRQGLSPRVRGNRVIDGTAKCENGSIPACAGEPPRSARSRSQ